MKIGVIGAGIGGLSVAALLAKDGHEVHVYEKNSRPGGRADVFSAEGFTFDAGPSWYLMPEVFERYFSLLERDRNHYYSLTRLVPAYKVFFDYRSPVTITGNLEDDAELFESIEKGSSHQLKKYVESAERTYHTALRHFLYENVSYRTFFQTEVIMQTPKLISLLTQNIHSYVSRRFKKKELQQILEYPMVFLGASPFKAPAMYHLMSYIDFKQGVFYPDGGVTSVIHTIEQIAGEYNTNFHYNAEITKIGTKKDIARSLHFKNGSVEDFDIIISNADLHHTEMKLLSPENRSYDEEFWSKATQGPSALLLYLGIKGTLPALEHHNLFFVEEWKQNFADIFETKKWPKTPSMYVCNPSKTDSTVSPLNTENIFVLVPLPAGTKHNINIDRIDRYVDSIIKFIEKQSGCKFSNRIMYKKVFSPSDFETSYNSWLGSALGLSHTLNQSALFRPGIKSKKLKNLYYVGGNVQPGIGLPMCLISAELVYKNIGGTK